ncbi:LytTR family transcriptional regulator [Shewanella sp. 202IG2-18]|uniref:LytTR family DNA-binding domain-containing protein n=1 Tax=Parashewanella hymeniacidonis TaxID=2807618 RepID=UPI0019606475|nr:LytTR family DNA-binding domain-containing protein [Parashewanella hymeniacidonis]MBM7073281.1 LytTR family transcriptional regulator [Parashewanella hymeniacidonis]
MNVQTILLKSERLRTSLLMVVIGIFIGFLAPFGMHQYSLLITIPYWSVTCLLVYWIFSPLHNVGDEYLTGAIKPAWLRQAIMLLFSSLIFALLLPLWNIATLSLSFNYFDVVIYAFPQVLVIATALTLLSIAKNRYIQQRQQLIDFEQQTTSKNVEKTIANQQLTDFLMLLPEDKQGQLLCLEMDDHYLKVHTHQGQHLLLMRFKDALERLSAYSGFQTHRSWWVAKDAISEISKDGRKYSITLSNRMQVPVSKTFEPRIKALQQNNT